MNKRVISYGVYLPYLRIKRDEYISARGSCSAAFKEKAVMDIDEDIITMAIEAARDAVSGIDAAQIGALSLASANFPYSEKIMAGTVIEALGLNNNILTCQHGNSTLAGTEAFLSAMGMLDQTEQKYALVIVADAPVAAAAVDLEHGFGAGACAFVLAKDEPGLELEGVYAQAGEAMGLRYRLPGETGVRDIGVKTYANQVYNEIIKGAAQGLLQKMQLAPNDYSHVVLHQNDAKTAAALAKKMGFGEEQLNYGQVFSLVGDTGACSTMLGLCHVLENARSGDRIMICSYGSGAGSHAISFKLSGACKNTRPVKSLLENKKYISYIYYLKLKRCI